MKFNFLSITATPQLYDPHLQPSGVAIKIAFRKSQFKPQNKMSLKFHSKTTFLYFVDATLFTFYNRKFTCVNPSQPAAGCIFHPNFIFLTYDKAKHILLSVRKYLHS
jgi:hypothetical protein